MTDNNDHNNSVRPNLSPSVGGALALANTRKKRARNHSTTTKNCQHNLIVIRQ